jgi:two-component system, OmpR family, sensor kinase
MAVVLAVAGIVLHNHLAGSLDRTLNQSLRSRAADVAALVGQGDTGLRETRPSPEDEAGTSFAQVLDSRGRIFDQTGGLGTTPLLTPPQLARARTATLSLSRPSSDGDSVRLLAIPVTAQDQRLVVVVGTSLGLRHDALASLRNELLVGGPVALVLVSLFGYLVAGAALRPVERMRLQASAISDRDLSERLPVPDTHDEIARLGETLNDMLDRLEAGITRERGFLADASHELRTPVTLLRAEVELALEAPRSNEELVASLRSIEEEADRLSQLAEDLLLLNRIDDGVIPLVKRPVSLDELLEGVATRFARRAGERCRRIETDGRGLRVNADRSRLEQALGNLVDNALRYGSGTVRLLVVERRVDIEIHVTDEGEGLPPSFAARAFDRFSRADDARASGGAGLGLAIAKAIAEAHGGAARVTDQPGTGAKICLSIPADVTYELESL